MPTSLLSTDTMFPNFKGNETTEEKVDQIQNYLYMLVEQLRYSMANIGEENFNETEFDNIVNLITEPVYLQLKSSSEDARNYTETYVEASENGINIRIEGVNSALETALETAKESLGAQIDGVSDGLSTANGEIDQLNKTTVALTASISGFNASVSDLSGKYTELQQTVSGFNATVGEINGQYSSITQNVASISTKVDRHDGRFSSIEQSVSNIKLSVKDNADGTASIELSGGGGGSGTIKLTGEVTFQALQDRGYLTSDNIDSTMVGKGFVTESQLEFGTTTTINGGNITTGTIKGAKFMSEGEDRFGNEVNGSFVVTKDNFTTVIGGIRYTKERNGNSDLDPDWRFFSDKLYLYTNSYLDVNEGGFRPASIKIYSVGRASMEAISGKVFIGSYAGIDNDVDIYGSCVRIQDAVYGTVWQFKNGGLYKNEVQVL